MTLADPGTHTTAVAALLRTEGIVTGDAGAPTVKHSWQGTPGRSTFIPYVIVYRLEQSFDGSLGCPDSDSDFIWQVTCVADTRAACDTLHAAVNEALVGATLTVSGRSVPRVRSDGGPGPRRDESVNPPLFISTPRFAAMST